MDLTNPDKPTIGADQPDTPKAVKDEPQTDKPAKIYTSKLDLTDLVTLTTTIPITPPNSRPIRHLTAEIGIAPDGVASPPHPTRLPTPPTPLSTRGTAYALSL